MNQSLLLPFCWLAICATCFGTVRESREASCTRDTLGNLRLAFERYYTEYATVPTGDTRAVMAALTGNSTDGQNPRKIVFFEFRAPRARSHFWSDDAVPGDRGSDGLPIDGWGRSVILTLDPATMQATFRSLGRNGRDDAGHPDDVVFTYTPKG